MATVQYVYPTSVELSAIDQDFLPVLMQSDPIFKKFPVQTHDAALVSWEQRDSYTGLAQVRGYDGKFVAVPTYGIKKYNMDPGVYGEFDVISELEITTRKGFGSLASPIDISDMVTERQEKLATRHFQRMAQVLWTMLVTGRYSIPHPNGTIIKEDIFTPQTFSASVPWSTAATSTPLADFRAVQLLHRGHSINLGSGSVAFMNRKTFNYFIANTNAADIGGRRTTGLQTVEGLTAANELLTKDDLPNIVVYDEGYLSDGTDGNSAGTFVPYIPDSKVVVIGSRLNGAAIGEFALTRNANNPDLSSKPLVKVVDTGAGDNQEPPRQIKVFRGFNGGPVIWYGNAIVVMSV